MQCTGERTRWVGQTDTFYGRVACLPYSFSCSFSVLLNTPPSSIDPAPHSPGLLPLPYLDRGSEIEEIGGVGLGQSSGLNYTSAVMRAASRVD